MRMSRNALAAAVAAVLALGATAATAEAQDSAAANQGQETGQVSDSSTTNDTAGYGEYQPDTSAQTDSAQRTTPKMPQQGGPVDTAGYTKFKETMGKAGDTLSPPVGETTNYEKQDESGKGDGSAVGDSAAGSSRQESP